MNIFDQLKTLFEKEVAVADVNHTHHATVLAQVVLASFSQVPSELCERVPKIIATILQAILKRPGILLQRPMAGWPLAQWLTLRLLRGLVSLQDKKERAQVERVLATVLNALWTTLLPKAEHELAAGLASSLLRTVSDLKSSCHVRIFTEASLTHDDLNELSLTPEEALGLRLSLANVLLSVLCHTNSATLGLALRPIVKTGFEILQQPSIAYADKLAILELVLRSKQAPSQATRSLLLLLESRLMSTMGTQDGDAMLMQCVGHLQTAPRELTGQLVAQAMTSHLQDAITKATQNLAASSLSPLQQSLLALLVLPLSDGFVHSLLPPLQEQELKSLLPAHPALPSRKRKLDEDPPSTARAPAMPSWKSTIQRILLEFIDYNEWGPHESLDLLVTKLLERLVNTRERAIRQKLLRALMLFPCARTEQLALEHDHWTCKGCDPLTSSSARIMADSCLKVVLAFSKRLLTSDQPVFLRVGTFYLLQRFLNHVRSNVDLLKLFPPPARNPLMETVLRHVVSDERSIQFAAGMTLVSIAAAHHAVPVRKDCYLDTALNRLDTYADPSHRNKRSLQETCLVTLSSLHQYLNDPERFLVLRVLTMHLGRQTDPLAAVAYQRIQAMARALSTTPSRLYAPWMSKILTHVYDRLGFSQRSSVIISALSDLTGISPEVFIKQNVAFILPGFLLQKNNDGCNYLESMTGTSVGALCAENAGQVLGSLYLRSPTDTKEGVGKVVYLIGSDFNTIYNACSQRLLYELVFELGDQDEKRQLQALDAIKRLDRDVHASRVAYTPDIQRLLSEHILALLSQMNENLNDNLYKRNLHDKAKILRSLAKVVDEVGTGLGRVTPQVTATLQSSLRVPGLEMASLLAWNAFVHSMKFSDIAPFIGQTSAAFASLWTHFQEAERTLARKILEYLIVDHVREMGSHVNEMANLSTLHGLQGIQDRIDADRQKMSVEKMLKYMLARVASENQSVCLQGLRDLKTAIEKDYKEHMIKFLSGDLFDPIVGHLIKTVIGAAHRAGDTWSDVRDAAFELLGILGAVDPDRCEMPSVDTGFILQRNFQDINENIEFVLNLIKSVLAGSYQASNDTKHQVALAFTIQELLKYCGYTKDVLDKKSNSLPERLRMKWTILPTSVVESIAPLLDSKYTSFFAAPQISSTRPIYKVTSTYRDWIKAWTLDLVAHVEDKEAKRIFHTFVSPIKLGDLSVARRILPHIALHLVMASKSHKSGPNPADDIRQEIISILSDQVDSRSAYSADARLLCAQVVFDVMDHLSKWTRTRGFDIARKKQQLKKQGNANHADLDPLVKPLTIVQHSLSNIPQHLQAQAALKCKAFARSLMSFELLLHSATGKRGDSRSEYYEAMHQIYAELNEPDGMEGISTLILHPSLRHQIREHEVLGKWTAAQSCWELQLQREPGNVDSHIGLLKCLRNLGHYDSLRTHINGLLKSHPAWRPILAPFEVEGAFIGGDYEAVESVLRMPDLPSSPEVSFARVLYALRTGAPERNRILSEARAHFGTEIAAAGQESYRRVYDAVLRLHILHELDLIHQDSGLHRSEAPDSILKNRLLAISPAFRDQELVLAMRRAAFGICRTTPAQAYQESWLMTAKISRKAGHQSTAYSAILQAEHLNAPFAFLESAKLLKARHDGRPDQALKLLEKNLDTKNWKEVATPADSVSLSKAYLKRARWMIELERSPGDIRQQFTEAHHYAKHGGAAQFHLGRYYDGLLKAGLEQSSFEEDSVAKWACFVVKCYIEALNHGTKFIYQAMPRILTIFMEIGSCNQDVIKLGSHSERIKKEVQMTSGIKTIERALKMILNHIERALDALPPWQWLVALQQLVSRIAHPNDTVFQVIETLLVRLLVQYTNPTFWAMVFVRKSTSKRRAKKCADIFLKSGSDPHMIKLFGTERTTSTRRLIRAGTVLVDQLVHLANHEVKGKEKDKGHLKIDRDFPNLAACMPSNLQIPLQSSFTITLPAITSESAGPSKTEYKPFPDNLPTFRRLENEVEVMSSLVQPKKITCIANTGEVFIFLCKPQDDLRKDARLMEFNSVINKLLKKDSASRKRGLHIRTYAVVPINEECGLIEWVPGTVGLRPILQRIYESRGVAVFSPEVRTIYDSMRDEGPAKSAAKFVDTILPRFKPVFHEWFLEQFPEPSTWFTSRQAYTRTNAVMCIVGFVLGLGDRHGENILLDSTCGDTVHVDFNCLFDKGKSFEVPEQVPFRLTQNIIDGFGITGIEGVFRRSAEVTTRILRAHHEALMSVMESFVHDPLLEWAGSKKKKRKGQDGESAQDQIARSSLEPIRRKLQGVQSTSAIWSADNTTNHIASVENQVESVIREATDPANLSQMYVGWASYL